MYHNPNSTLVDGANDNNQSEIHSRLIEDLLSDNDQTEVYDNSHVNSMQTTVVHTPQLSISSFYKQLPPTQGSSLNQGFPQHHHNSNSNFGQFGSGPSRYTAFENSGESEEASVQQMMNNLMIQVGHSSK